jgi:hypothetical protein
MATVIKEPTSEPPFEVPGPSYYDERDMLGVRLGVPFRLHFLATFGLPTQLGTIWLGAWGVASVAFFVAGLAVLFASGIASMNGNVLEYVRHFANVQELPPDGGMARSLSAGGYWPNQHAAVGRRRRLLGRTLLGAAAALQLAAVPVLRVALGDSVDVDDLGVSPDPHGDLGRGARARIQFRPRLGAELQRPVGQPVLRYGGVAVRSFAQADRAHRSYLCAPAGV